MPASLPPGPRGAAPRQPARLRHLGLVATALLAAGTWTAGALPWRDPAAAVARAEPLPLAGLAGWLAGTVLLVTVWWRARRHATDVRWVLVTGVLWALPLLVAPPLGSRDVYAYACQGAVYLDGHDPYAVGPAAGGCPWLSAVPTLWHDTPAPYGPLAILVSAAAAAVARAVPLAEETRLLVAVGVLRAVAIVGIAVLTWYAVRLARMLKVDPAAAAWLGVITPLVLVHAVSGAHNDALLAGLLVAALAMAAGRETARPEAVAVGRGAEPAQPVAAHPWRAALGAGALLGLAAAVKVTALVALPFAVLLVAGCATWRPVLRAAGLIGGAAAAVFAALSAVTGLGLGWVDALRGTGSLVQWTSLPSGVGMAAGYLLRVLGAPEAYDEAVAVARALGLAVLAGLLVMLWLRARPRAATSPRAVVLAGGAALAATAVLSPVFYPWYALAPLAALAVCVADDRVRRWCAVATVALSFLVLPYGLGVAVRTKLPGALLDVAAVVALVWWWRRHRKEGRTLAAGRP